MKRLFLFLLATLTMTAVLAQRINTPSSGDKEAGINNDLEVWESLKDSLSEEQMEVLCSLTESVMLTVVDSVMNEGRYMEALENLDSLQMYWKRYFGKNVSPKVYHLKAIILNSLEEWQEVIKTTEECFAIYKTEVPIEQAAAIYGLQGSAHRMLREYLAAIRSYENALKYYVKNGEDLRQCDVLCNMAYCYGELGKHTMASSFYQKGIGKYLECFKTTRAALLKGKFNVNDPNKQLDFKLFALHLFYMAVYEQDLGNKLESKEYLQMSAHCGFEDAKKEYQRLYGN